MKLYLSSFRLGDHPEKLRELFTQNIRIAIVPNAKDNYEPSHRKERLEEEVKSLNELGLDAEVVDLRDYFGNPEDLARKLDTFGGVWVVGGNTFVLRVAIKESGFDEWVKEKIKEKDFVYAGYSAGICVLAPTLEGIDIVDNLQEVNQAYKKDVLWDGLGIVDYSFAPHYRSDHPESELVEKEVEYMKLHNIPFKTLQDGEVLLLEIRR